MTLQSWASTDKLALGALKEKAGSLALKDSLGLDPILALQLTPDFGQSSTGSKASGKKPVIPYLGNNEKLIQQPK